MAGKLKLSWSLKLIGVICMALMKSLEIPGLTYFYDNTCRLREINRCLTMKVVVVIWKTLKPHKIIIVNNSQNKRLIICDFYNEVTSILSSALYTSR